MLRIPCMRRSVAPLRGNPFNFRWALQRCANRAAGLFARQVLGTLALTSICNQWTNSIFFQRSLWTRSSFCADWLKIPRDFREKYILKNKIKKLKKEEEKKNENRFDTVSMVEFGRLCTRHTSTYTRRLYDNGRASGWSPCFRCDCHHPIAHFSTLTL